MRAMCARKAEHREGLVVIRLRPNLPVEAAHRLHIVIEDIRPGFKNPRYSVRIAAEIRSQYLLQYYSNNESANRTFRRIAVSTPPRPELRVRTREGYYPKAK